MSDWAAIAAQAKAAREVQCSAGGHTFTLRVPTRHECVRIAHKSDSQGNLALLQRALLEEAIVGWLGPRLRDLFPGTEDSSNPEADAPLEWAAQGVPLLLDAQPGWEDTLNEALVDALNDRHARAKAAAGN